MEKYLEEEIRKICTYYSELGEGTAGYSLSEEQFQKLFTLLSKTLKEVREEYESPNKMGFSKKDILRITAQSSIDQMKAHEKRIRENTLKEIEAEIIGEDDETITYEEYSKLSKKEQFKYEQEPLFSKYRNQLRAEQRAKLNSLKGGEK